MSLHGKTVQTEERRRAGALEEDEEQAEEYTKETITRKEMKVGGAMAETGGTRAEMGGAGGNRDG